jgi:tetratricopeptide (TPR) repeat protein
VIGWFADFFRFWWALAYWNTRKTWFRLQGAHRDSCPCQIYSDSGLALDSRCEAVSGWNDPRRFRRVCPLLTETKQGWRCGVDAERVRPFWGRALVYGGGTLLALYLFGTVALYATLRARGYQVAYVTVVWPPRWPELRHSQELLYAKRARQAMAAGDYKSAILSLQTVCLLNPQNAGAALSLAHLLQLAGQTNVAEHIYARLMQDVPEQRAMIAQTWGRLLLARADYDAIKPLAIAMLSEDSGRREAWLNALLFAARQSNDAAVLAPLLTGEHGLPAWCVDIAGTEQLLLLRQPERALPRLVRVQSQPPSRYLPYYQVDRLLRLGQADLAINVLNAYGKTLPEDEASLLRLRGYRLKGWTSLADPEFESLLRFPMNQRLATLCSAYLLEWPGREYAARFTQRFLAAAPALSEETLPVYQATYLVAFVAGGPAQAQPIGVQIDTFTKSDNKALRGLAELLQAQAPTPALIQLLPSVALPLEAAYAVHSRPAAPAKP